MKPTFRCSELDRILTCNGSISAVPRVNPRDSDEGWEGTLIHWMVADRLIRELGATPPEGGLPPAEVPKGYKIPSNSLWIVDWCVRHARETIDPDWSLMVEVALAYEFGRWILSGHLDHLAMHPEGKRSKGGDWKSVRDPVDPADNNEQVGGYIVLEKRAWDELEIADFDIVQPRVTEDDEVERVSSVRVTNLEALVTTLDRRVCAAMDNAMELNSGKKQCGWCPVGCQCFALQAEQNLMKIQMTPEMLAKIKKTPDDALLGDWIVSSRMLERPTKDAKEMLHKRLDETACVVAGSGTIITRELRRGSIEILQPLEFYQATKELLVTDENMAAVMKPSKTRIIDQLATAMNVPKGGLADVTAESIYAGKLEPMTKQDMSRVLKFS